MSTGQLQVMSSYSLLNSTIKIDELVEKSQEFGYQSLALTDLNTMTGVFEFDKACRRSGINPLFGVTLDYQSSFFETSICRLVLIAKNQQGYSNLLKIVSLRNESTAIEDFDIEKIKPHLADLVMIIPCEASEWYRVFQAEKNESSEWQSYVTSLFAKVDVYHTIDESELFTEKNWLGFLEKQGIATVASQPLQYLSQEDYFAYEVLRHIQSGEKLSEPVFSQKPGPYYLKTCERRNEFYKKAELLQALKNNQAISDMCHVELLQNQKLLPAYPILESENAADLLKKLCQDGLKKRKVSSLIDYQERLKYELNIIHDMGYDDYFLIVWDVMKYAREHNIITACRGSAAGSLVAYVLEITQVDPIRYDLLFERFLNPERYTMPDIDIDIPDNRREAVLEYVYQKYGEFHVAQIATFGTLAAKQSLRDVGRTFGLSQSEMSQWSNSVPGVLKITLKEALQQSRALQALVNKNERQQLLFKTALKLEGLPRHISTHAAGVVISDQDLRNFVPLQTSSTNIPLTQFTMGDVERVGLLKMDFLGLRNLAIVNNALDSINYDRKNQLLLEDIPLDDEQTLALFRMGQTDGIFQFESDGIKKVLKKLKPNSIEDIASVNALYRPGPMKNIDLFIARKQGKEAIDYLTPQLEPILEKTYGVIVYQEQVMKIVAEMAGFSLSQADMLRRAISKKEKETMDQERQHFVKGAIEKGYTKELAHRVYDYIETFANYGFNRSHAVVYSVLAYQMAYLKVHFPVQFLIALLHSVKNSQGKLGTYLLEARQLEIKVLPPRINESQISFTQFKGKILYGFSSIKGLRRDFIQHFTEIRKQNGSFQSLENFLLRLDQKWLKEEYILPLIYSGAFDQLHSNRKQLVVDLASLIQNIQYSSGSIDLLGFLSLKNEKTIDFTTNEKLEQEIIYLGNYLSGHPTDKFKQLQQIYQTSFAQKVRVGEKTRLLIYLTEVKKIRTKKGESMVFLNANDTSGELELTVFPKLYRELQFSIPENEVYYVEGRVELSRYNQQKQVIITKIIPANELEQSISEKKCFIKWTEENNHSLKFAQLEKILIKYSGNHPVIVVLDSPKKPLMLEAKYWVKESEKLIFEVQELLGMKTIIFQ
ncbi:DNA polymerase III subunit alpha [Vagococcus sp.]|uniref:DNA polymerase III subunit alpha n=1 Tax=Vagococcus sp. TaxID=1933889 RepID=UPI003F9966C0